MSITVSEQQKVRLLEGLEEDYEVADISHDFQRDRLTYILPNGTFLWGKGVGMGHAYVSNMREFQDICDSVGIRTPRQSGPVGIALAEVAGVVQITSNRNHYDLIGCGLMQPTQEQLDAIAGFFQNDEVKKEGRGLYMSSRVRLKAEDVTAGSLREAFAKQKAYEESKGRQR